jgi:hypothetical protein
MPRKSSKKSSNKVVHAGTKRKNLTDDPASKRSCGDNSSGGVSTAPKEDRSRSASSAQTTVLSITHTGEADHSARHSNDRVITDDDADGSGNPGVARREPDESEEENSDDELGTSPFGILRPLYSNWYISSAQQGMARSSLCLLPPGARDWL